MFIDYFVGIIAVIGIVAGILAFVSLGLLILATIFVDDTLPKKDSELLYGNPELKEGILHDCTIHPDHRNIHLRHVKNLLEEANKKEKRLELDANSSWSSGERQKLRSKIAHYKYFLGEIEAITDKEVSLELLLEIERKEIAVLRIELEKLKELVASEDTNE